MLTPEVIEVPCPSPAAHIPLFSTPIRLQLTAPPAPRGVKRAVGGWGTERDNEAKLSGAKEREENIARERELSKAAYYSRTRAAMKS